MTGSPARLGDALGVAGTGLNHEAETLRALQVAEQVVSPCFSQQSLDCDMGGNSRPFYHVLFWTIPNGRGGYAGICKENRVSLHMGIRHPLPAYHSFKRLRGSKQSPCTQGITCYSIRCLQAASGCRLSKAFHVWPRLGLALPPRHHQGATLSMHSLPKHLPRYCASIKVSHIL